MSSFVQTSVSLFGLDTAERDASGDTRYVEVPVQWSRDEWDRPAGRVLPVESPLTMLAPQPDATVDATLSPPYVAMIIGPSGVGKTELIRQLCRRAASTSQFQVLPISLIQCSWKGAFQSFPEVKLSPADFGAYLFSGLQAQAKGVDVLAVFEQSLLRDLHIGKIVLALDGLDEVVTARDQHDAFFASLFEFLDVSNRCHDSSMRLIVSSRLEYLRALKVLSSAEILGRFAGSFRRPVQFLRLDFFDESRTKAYLIRRDQYRIFKEILDSAGDGNEQMRGVREMMQRPLFLKLLCDLEDLSPLRSASTIRTATELLDRLVDQALLAAPGRWRWDNNKLAAATVALFKRRGDAFHRKDIEQFVQRRLTSGFGAAGEFDAFETIHKCPFLRREGDSARFTHQVFFEYFVARGMALEARIRDETEFATADFDRFVLTPEMRRFLRDRMGEEAWRKRTKLSYGLSEACLRSWPDPAWASEHADELEEVRYPLLQFMTEPDVSSESAKPYVERFLALDHKNLHPLYLIYSYEAVAVYLWYNRWQSDEADLERRFEARIEDQLESALRALKGTDDQMDEQYHEATARLLLRILDIGRRLRLRAIVKYASRDKKFDAILKAVGEEDMKSEVQSIRKKMLETA